MTTKHQPLFDTIAAKTCTLASLATSATFVAGREAVFVDNTSALYDDARLSGKITVGTSPTANTQIQIYVFGSMDDTPTWPDAMAGADANKSITSVGVGLSFLKLAAVINVDSTTSNRTYNFDCPSVAQCFGGVLPKRFGIWVVHNTGVNLHATGGNHVINVQGVNGNLV